MIEILFENSDWIVVQKPNGVSVHNLDEAENLVQQLARQFRTEEFFPVHRLDKETSGIQIFALNPKKAAELAREFQDRSVIKIYHGILRGKMSEAQMVWNQPLTDKAEGRKNPQGVSQDRVPCETRVHVLRSNQYFTECQFQLITGRQHQIRKHSALARHALVGDNRYGDPRYNQKITELYKTDRMFLHCSRVEIAGKVITSPACFTSLDLQD